MTNSVIEKSCHRVMMGKTYWKGVVLPSALYGTEVIDMKGEEIDKLQKAENTAMRRMLRAPKWAAQAAIRGEIGISNMKSKIARSRLLYLRRIETENNEVLKRILGDSKKNKKSKWWGNHQKIYELSTNRITRNKRRYSERNQRKNSKGSGGRMERRTGEELLRDIHKIQKINERGGIQRKSRVNGVVESENKQLKSRREHSWQRNREMCVGCSEERETVEHFILHRPRWEEWRIESRSLQRARIEETDQVLGEFLFGGLESNTKKRTLLKMWNGRQRLIRNNKRMLKREKKNSRRIGIRKI